jgi:hypothetical protein
MLGFSAVVLVVLIYVHIFESVLHVESKCRTLV